MTRRAIRAKYEKRLTSHSEVTCQFAIALSVSIYHNAYRHTIIVYYRKGRTLEVSEPVHGISPKYWMRMQVIKVRKRVYMGVNLNVDTGIISLSMC